MNNRISSKRVGSDVKPILAFENVSKDYGKLRALDGVSLTVNRGEVINIDRAAAKPS